MFTARTHPGIIAGPIVESVGIVRPSGTILRRSYSLELRGGSDSIYPPMSNIESSRKQSEPAYMSLTVHPSDTDVAWLELNTDPVAYITETAYYAGGTTWDKEFLHCQVDAITTYYGGGSFSMVIEGHDTIEYGLAREITLQKVVSIVQEDGNNSLVCEIDTDVDPGDTVRYGSVSFVASTVRYSIGATSASMTLEE